MIVGNVVYKEESIGLEIGSGPETSVFFLAGGIGKGQVVVESVDCSGD